MKTFYVTVKIQVEDDADVNDVVENCNYIFIHDDILNTEIIETLDTINWNPHSLLFPMKIKVKSIEIDFTDDVCDCPPDTTYQQDVIESVLNTEWIVDDEEDLVDEISDEIGWCIYKIDYDIL